MRTASCAEVKDTLRAFMAAVVTLLLPCIASAQTWSGLGADNNWSTGANWIGGVAPASSPTTVVTFQLPTPRISPAVDMPWIVNRIEIGSYIVSGQPLTFAGAAAEIRALGPNSRITAPIVLAGPLTATSGLLLTLSGGISGTGPLTVSGPHFTTIAGVNTFTGGVLVIASAGLAITGSMPGPVTVSGTPAILSGTGTVAGLVTVNAGAFFNLLNGVFSAGGVTLAGTTHFAINGSTQGTGYSFLNVTGPVTLAGGALTLSGAYLPAPGQVFTVIENDGTDPVTGIFVGLAEGGLITFNGRLLRISYRGGSGNDVQLTALSMGPAEAVPTLSEWALLLLAVIVAVAGMRGASMRRRGR